MLGRGDYQGVGRLGAADKAFYMENRETFLRLKQAKMRDDWDAVKPNIIFNILLNKFNRNRDLLEKLLATGDAKLIEDSPYDYYWGIGKDGSGRNVLGQLLGKVREYFRERE